MIRKTHILKKTPTRYRHIELIIVDVFKCLAIHDRIHNNNATTTAKR